MKRFGNASCQESAPLTRVLTIMIKTTKSRSVSLRTLAVSVAVIIAIVFLTVYLLRDRSSNAKWERAERAHALAAAKIFDTAPSVSADDVSAIAESIASAPTIPNQLNIPHSVRLVEATPAQRTQLGKMIAQWIKLTSDADPDAYAAWMRSRGWSLARDRSDVASIIGPDMKWSYQSGIYEYFSGSPMPENISAEELFRFMFTHYYDDKRYAIRPVRVATGSSADATLFRIVTSSLPNLQPWSGNDQWFNNTTVGFAHHWAPPILFSELLNRDGEVLTSKTLIAIANHRGDWIPLAIASFWDPERALWNIYYITYSNTVVGADREYIL